MHNVKKKGFTLIELIAVLVIMAIITLIATPLVMNIIRKARISADRRSIDAYGRSIELAIAGYLLDTGKFPTEVSQLTIEYSGNKVECTTTQINTDSSVYLAGCTVNGRSVDYSYGSKEAIAYDYRIGDLVTYNNVDYRVIKDSTASESSLTLLKAIPLTVAQVNQYGGVGTQDNHVNMYVNTSASYYQTAYDRNGYGGMAYYSSETCSGKKRVCRSDYVSSDIKYVVDSWKSAEASIATEARLITNDELIDNLGMNFATGNATSLQLQQTENTPMWIFGDNYDYWTMTSNTDRDNEVWGISMDGSIVSAIVNGNKWASVSRVIRPVIVLPKSALN